MHLFRIQKYLLAPLVYMLIKTFKSFAIQSFDNERIWWRLLQKRDVCTKLDIYDCYYDHWVDYSAGRLLVLRSLGRLLCWSTVGITITGSITLLVDCWYYDHLVDYSAGRLLVLRSLGRLLCWSAVGPVEYHLPSSHWFRHWHCLL